MGVLFVLFALAMAVATFLENDFGSPAAYSMVYGTTWFELILLLLAVNLIGQLIVFKLFKKTRVTGALFHLAFIVMILGAGITRYFGWEGSIHIREGEEQNECFSTEKYIGYSIKDSEGKVISSNSQKYSLTSVTAENYKKKLTINNKDYKLVLSKVIPNTADPGIRVIQWNRVRPSTNLSLIFLMVTNQQILLFMIKVQNYLHQVRALLTEQLLKISYGSKVHILTIHIKA